LAADKARVFLRLDKSIFLEAADGGDTGPAGFPILRSRVRPGPSK
jgi:hypothetical protein